VLQPCFVPYTENHSSTTRSSSFGSDRSCWSFWWTRATSRSSYPATSTSTSPPSIGFFNPGLETVSSFLPVGISHSLTVP